MGASALSSPTIKDYLPPSLEHWYYLCIYSLLHITFPLLAGNFHQHINILYSLLCWKSLTTFICSPEWQNFWLVLTILTASISLPRNVLQLQSPSVNGFCPLKSFLLRGITVILHVTILWLIWFDSRVAPTTPVYDWMTIPSIYQHFHLLVSANTELSWFSFKITVGSFSASFAGYSFSTKSVGRSWSWIRSSFPFPPVFFPKVLT